MPIDPVLLLGRSIDQALRAISDDIVTPEWQRFHISFSCRRIDGVTQMDRLHIEREPLSKEGNGNG